MMGPAARDKRRSEFIKSCDVCGRSIIMTMACVSICIISETSERRAVSITIG